MAGFLARPGKRHGNRPNGGFSGFSNSNSGIFPGNGGVGNDTYGNEWAGAASKQQQLDRPSAAPAPIVGVGIPVKKASDAGVSQAEEVFGLGGLSYDPQTDMIMRGGVTGSGGNVNGPRLEQ